MSTGPELIRLDTLPDPAPPELAVFRNMKDQWLRAAHRPGAATYTSRTGLDPSLPGDLFIAEGIGLLGRLLESRHAVLSLLVSDTQAEAVRQQIGSRSTGPLFTAPRPVLETITGFDLHRGVLACGQRTWAPTPDQILARPGPVLILEDLANHDNVGSIFRSAAALGAPPPAPAEAGAGVLLSPGCCDPLYRKALRVSMGHALRVPFARLDEYHAGLEAAARSGRTLIALTPRGKQRIDRLIQIARPALLIGAEGPGLTDETLELIESLGGITARIDIEPSSDSLNAGVAAAVALAALRPDEASLR